MRATNRNAKVRRAALENLEQRQMMSADVSVDTINLYGTPGNDTFTYDVVDYSDPDIGRVNNWTINNTLGQEITPFIYHVNIFGFGGDDDIRLSNLKSGMTVNIYTMTGDDHVNIEENQGKVNFNDAGGSHDSLRYWASHQLAESETYVGTDAVVPYRGATRGIHFTPGAIETMNVDGTGYNSRIFVDAVVGGTSVNIDGREGDDIITVGNGDIDSNIKGKLFIKDSGNHGFGKENNTIILDDSKDAGGDLTTLGAHNLTKTSMTVSPFFTGMQHVQLKETDNDDSIKVTAADATDIKVLAGAGNDQIELGYGRLDAFAYTMLTVDGGAGNDVLIAKDNAVYSYEAYKITPGKFNRSGMNTISDPNVELLNLFASNAPSGDKIDGSAATQKLIINGGSGADIITGGSNDDILRGGGGNDAIHGHEGNDTLDGGAGADFMSGGADYDTADYSGRTKPLNIDLNVAYGDGEAGESDFLYPDLETFALGSGNDKFKASNFSNVFVYGNAGNDTIYGSNQNDFLRGGAGKDVIQGNGGNDWLVGDAGEDKISGGDGDDVLYLQDGEKDQYYGDAGSNTYYKDAADFKQKLT